MMLLGLHDGVTQIVYCLVCSILIFAILDV